MGVRGAAVRAILVVGVVSMAPGFALAHGDGAGAHSHSHSHEKKKQKDPALWVEAKGQQLRREKNELTLIAKKALPSVASITTRSSQSGGASILGEPQKGIGSGFVIHPDGLIVTASHVIEDADEITVTLVTDQGFTEEYNAELLGTDPTTDIALLRIRPTRKLPVLPLGTATNVNIADWVVVIGNPFGLSHSVTVGVVSYIGRTDVMPSGRNGQFDYIQTDASINPGNSGGPVLNLRGEVIAIANAVNVSGQGIAFAVPVDVAKAVVPHLEKHGQVRRGYMGAGVQDMSPSVAESFGIPVRKGVVVAEVEEDSPAARAGLRVGDIITGLDSGAVSRAHVLRWRISTRGPESSLKLRVIRNGKPRELSVRLLPLEDYAEEPLQHVLEEIEPEEEHGPDGPENQVEAELGALLMDPQEGSGAEIASIAAESPLARAGLTEGDVVLRVNDTAVTDADELSRLFVSSKRGQELNLYIQRGDHSLAIPFRRP